MFQPQWVLFSPKPLPIEVCSSEQLQDGQEPEYNTQEATCTLCTVRTAQRRQRCKVRPESVWQREEAAPEERSRVGKTRSLGWGSQERAGLGALEFLSLPGWVFSRDQRGGWLAQDTLDSWGFQSFPPSQLPRSVRGGMGMLIGRVQASIFFSALSAARGPKGRRTFLVDSTGSISGGRKAGVPHTRSEPPNERFQKPFHLPSSYRD